MSRNPADSSHDAPRARLTADEAVAAGRDFVELQAGPAGVFWTEYDPADAMCRIWRARDGVIEAVSPDGFSARGRVYEYGGGAFCLAGEQVVFVNERDQRIYRFAPGSLAAPEPLTAEGLRYGALRHARGRILAVEEEGDTHRLVSIGLHDGSRELLAEGADFYAAPVLSADGRQLAWIEWQHPHQPWTATRLKLRRYAAEGGVLDERTLAGEGDDEALQQPGFDAEGRLVCLSDRAGFWQPWRLEGERLVALPAEAGDHAGAPWQLGASSWLPLAGGELFTTWFDEGWGRLGLRAADGTLTRIAPEYSLFQQLAADETHCYCLAASPECPAAILAIDRRDRRVEVLREVAPLVPVERITQPLPLRFRSGDRDAHGYLYLPAAEQAASDGAPAEPPPVVVFVHGGPTSVSHPVFSPRFEYWVQRGFAIALLNYRGSSGYGRAFRQALHLTWGVADVDDACALVEHLAAQGLVDARRAFIRGGSAGGYTALCALAFRDVFRGGASLYGVSDPLQLDAHTHKFEARYLRWLIGDPVADRERYLARTPLAHADQIRAPVVFFQGELDAVVTPDQTRSMAEALDANGVPNEVHYYADERHGFRRAVNQAHSLEAEHAFYRRILDGGI
ncbi:S9 family peptidase [Burkholderia gladioli]|uniref:S9 family peptidase n=1 Tax=Burkholderia gladioli TaxID=28095 RepID=UPI00163E1DD0|nr:prolyl oligopeptidase family serine peptidase [Burkholderia gladioli]